MTRRGRSARSYVVELVVAVVAIGLINLFLVNGGPSIAGEFWADLFGAP